MLQLKTNKLKEMVTKAFKGVGNDRNKPITELIALKLEDGTLTLITTDYDNFMYVCEEVEADGAFYAVVQANQFVKLISRLTSDEVTLNVAENCLEVKGNGTYKIPVEIDAGTGKIVEYTDPLKAISFDDIQSIGEITEQDISTIIRALKPSLAQTVEIPQYVNYYIGETVLSTDTNTASCYEKELVSEPILVSAAVMEMLGVYSSETPIAIYKKGNRLIFRGENFTLFGYAMPGLDEYQVDAIQHYLGSEYPSMCQLPKQEMLQALDRLSLFVSDFDEDKIGISFTEDGLVLSSKQSDSVETVKYLKKVNLEETSCFIYLYMLTSQIKAQTGDTIDLYFGEERSVKLVDNACKVVSVLCLVK